MTSHLLKTCFITCTLTLMPVLTGLAASPKKPITIMPLGDSITVGGNSLDAGSVGNYRYVLMSMLLNAGYNVAFVGSKNTYVDPMSDLDRLEHEGHGGKNVQWLAGNMKGFYQRNPADIIILHAGHNNFADKTPIPEMIEATKKIISVARSINPKVTVLVAQVISSGKLPKYSYIPEFNQELIPLAAELSTEESPVILVNQEANFDWRTDTIKDKVHPSREGAKKIAETWYPALVQVLPTPDLAK